MKEVLLIDDQVDIQSMIADLLRNYGLHVEACANGQQASRRLQDKKYDLIITDLMMPKEDGFSFIYKARNVYLGSQNTPIIVITGGSNSMDFQVSLENLSKEDNLTILSKPFSKNILLESVCNAFDIDMDNIDSLLSVH